MKEIADILSPYMTEQDDQRLVELLAFSAGRVLLKVAKSGKRWRSQVSEEKLREAWLSNVDGQGRPRKLLKFSSIEQIVQEANKAMMGFPEWSLSKETRNSTQNLGAGFTSSV